MINFTIKQVFTPGHKALLLLLATTLHFKLLAQTPLIIEAEDGILRNASSTHVSEQTDGDITYIQVDNNETSVNNTDQLIDYTVNFTETGTYNIYVKYRIDPNSTNAPADDSFYGAYAFGQSVVADSWSLVNQIDSKGYTSGVIGGSGSTAFSLWRWIDITIQAGMSSFTVASTGTQTWSLATREDGLHLDKIVFAPAGIEVSDLETVASSAKPAPAVVQAESGTAAATPSSFTVGTVGAIDYLKTTTDGAGDNPGVDTKVVTYSVSFDSIGTYNLFARILIPSDNGGGAVNDSFFFGKTFGTKGVSTTSDWYKANAIDGSGFTSTSSEVNGTGNAGTDTWKWLNLSSISSVVYSVSDMNALTQTFQIGSREDGLQIDAFVFAAFDSVYTVSSLNTIVGAASTSQFVQWDGSSWSNGSGPDGGGTSEVIINGAYSLDSDGIFDAKNISVLNGASLTIDGDNTFTVHGDLSTEGTFTVASGASLLLNDTSEVTGDLSIHRNTRYADGKYSFVGSPIATNSTTTGDLGSHVYHFNETTAYGNDGLDRWVRDSTSTLISGKGYTQAFQQTIIFEGTPNIGDIDFEGTYTGTHNDETNEDHEGWNLISNPYPCALNIASFISGNTNTTGTIYLWDDNGSDTGRGTSADYVVANGTVATNTTPAGGQSRYNAHVGTAQAFFVKLNSDSDTTIHFTHAMRASENNADANFFRKAADAHIFRINLSNKDGLFKQAVLVNSSDADDAQLTFGVDAHVFNKEASDLIYSVKQGQPLAIQGFASQDRIMPLGLNIGSEGSYTISAENHEANGQDIFLIDHTAQTITNIASEAYHFDIEAGHVSGRFEVTTDHAVSDILSNTLIEELKVWAADKILYMKSTSQLRGEIQVINLLGQNIWNGKLGKAESMEIDLSKHKKGVYIVKHASHSTKILLK